MLINRYFPSQSVSSWFGEKVSNLSYENITFILSGNLVAQGNGTSNVSIFKMSGGFAWDNQARIAEPFTPPCTLEFSKWAGQQDNAYSYHMIGWNTDPTTNASYDTLDYASYPHKQTAYSVYNNGSQVLSSGTWSNLNKFYIVYGVDGSIKHYNGSTLLYSVSTGSTASRYVDSSFHSPGAVFGGFSNIRVIKKAWNGTSYT